VTFQAIKDLESRTDEIKAATATTVARLIEFPVGESLRRLRTRLMDICENETDGDSEIRQIATKETDET
jgi:hypothetical protein